MAVIWLASLQPSNVSVGKHNPLWRCTCFWLGMHGSCVRAHSFQHSRSGDGDDLWHLSTIDGRLASAESNVQSLPLHLRSICVCLWNKRDGSNAGREHLKTRRRLHILTTLPCAFWWFQAFLISTNVSCDLSDSDASLLWEIWNRSPKCSSIALNE